MKDNLILIVNEKGKLETAPIGMLKANANYTSTITVITPMPLNNVVMANFNKRNSVDWNVSQFLIPSGRKKGKDILDQTHDLYQKVYDWNVFEGIIDSKAVAYFAKYRADLLYVSIGVGEQQTPELAENYKGVFNYNKPLPETAENGDYYISNGYNFNDKNIKWTLNDIAYYWNGWKKSNYIGTFNTTSVAVPVDPNIPTNIEIVADQDLAVLLAGKIATIEEDIVNLDLLTQEHQIRISNLENDNEVNKTDIADLKLKDQEQDQRLDVIETDIDNITDSIKIDNDTLVRENEVIKVSDKLTNQIEVNRKNIDDISFDLVELDVVVDSMGYYVDSNRKNIQEIKETTYTKPQTDTKLNEKENKISQFVKDVKYDIANNRLTFEFKVGSNLVVNMTGGGVGGIDLEDVYLEENELVFIFTNEKEVRVPLGSLLVGMASEEWVEYRLNLYAEKADLDALTTDYNTFKQTNENRLNKLDNDIVNINDDISNITASIKLDDDTLVREEGIIKVSDTLTGTVSTLETTLNETQTTANANKTEISTLKTTTQTHTTQIGNINNKVNTIETELVDVNTEIANNATEIQSVKDTTYTKTQSDNKFATIQAMDLQLQEKLNVKPDGTNPLVIGNKLNSTYIDSLYITDVFVVADKSELTTLTAQRGDIAIVENESKTYVLKSGSPATLSNWVELLFPVSVVSVNGKTGAVILGISDIPELESTLNSKLAVNVFENFKDEVELDYAKKTDLTPYAKKTELFSKNYNDLTNKPTIPSKTSDLTNDSGYATETYVDNAVSALETSKQDKLVAGDNITIENNVISASGGGDTYTKDEINLMVGDIESALDAILGV